MTSSDPLVLAVEDEPQMMRFLRASLTAQSFRLAEATTAGTELRPSARWLSQVSEASAAKTRTATTRATHGFPGMVGRHARLRLDLSLLVPYDEGGFRPAN